MPAVDLTPELKYVGLLFALFIVPQLLQRWRLPAAITSLALGAVAGMGFGWFAGDATVSLLASFGIVALFLFAGLDVEFATLRRGAPIILQHLAVRILLLAGATWLLSRLLGLDVRPALLLALALLTPSTGFILHSLHAFGLSEAEEFWVKSKAIATELLALAVLFFTLASFTAQRLVVSTVILIAIIGLLPLLFRLFATWIAPFAPRSEFAFLLMLAVVFAYATRQLGVYYLVGAFLVGMAARRFRDRLPTMASEQMVHAVEVFASFFVPFYFFHAGLALHGEDLGPRALGLGVALVALAVPVRMLAIALHRRLALREELGRSVRVALALTPTLVFTLVLGEILRSRFAVGPVILGGLVLYAVLNTLLPGVLLRTTTPVYDAPALPAGQRSVHPAA